MSSELDLGWQDVLRRAERRSPRRRLALAAVVAVAAFGGAPALAVLLTRSAPPQLPQGADLANVSVVFQPQTGRAILKLAPWKGHDGFCYVVLQKRAGCMRRSKHETIAFWPPPVVITFDPRVVAVTHGRVYRFHDLRVAVVLPPASVRTLGLLDRQGRPVVRVRINR
jgi:hypothetical protein